MNVPKTIEDFLNRPCCISINGQNFNIQSSSSTTNSGKEDDLLHCVPIPIDTNLFSGVCYLLLAGVDTSPGLISFFQRYKRRLQYVIQGRFRQSIPFSQVYTGQAWEQPLAAAPPLWIQALLLPVIKGLQPGVRLELLGNNPSILSPLASTLQVLQIHLPGCEPSLPESIEKLVNDDLLAVGLDMTSKARKVFFSCEKNLDKHMFTPDHVCTFSFYQHFVRMDTFDVFGFDLLRVLGRNPIEVMAVVLDDAEKGTATGTGTGTRSVGSSPSKVDDDVVQWNFLYRIDIWHEKVLGLP